MTQLLPYPIDMSPYLAAWRFSLDAGGVPTCSDAMLYHPTLIAQYALVQWKRYLASQDERDKSAFLVQVRWLLEHETSVAKDAGGWPISAPPLRRPAEGSWLSATTQGNALSVLVRAYQLTRETQFLKCAYRIAQTFASDILDGGVASPVGTEGIFFEDVAVYPASHSFSGFVFALSGLHDYVALTGNEAMGEVIERGLSTMHTLLAEFDTGFWTVSDLLDRRLVSPSQLLLQAELLTVLANISGCKHCLQSSIRWQHYHQQPLTRLRYYIAQRKAQYSHSVRAYIQARFFTVPQVTDPLHVCVPITAFPVAGGTRAVLSGLMQVTAGSWRAEYLTQYRGPDASDFTIYTFGTAKMSPWQFPLVWLYFLAGLRKLTWLLHRRGSYCIILPQDGVFTGAFAVLAGKLAGARVVCIDHGNLAVLNSRIYRQECLQTLSGRRWNQHVRALLLRAYWPSLKLLARITARFADHFLVPGLAGDGLEDACQRLKIPASRITRFNNMIDAQQYCPVDRLTRANIRAKHGIATDAIVVALVCRLSPEKGIPVALESISLALSQLSTELRARVRVIIAGEGPLRGQLEEDIRARGLGNTCILWGEIAKPEVISLLRMSDIFLNTSTRGAGISVAILEAMACGCAVVASTMPLPTAQLLADGRGIAVPAQDVEQTSHALALLWTDLERCRRIGQQAREYVVLHHSPDNLRRSLLRVTGWSALDRLVGGGRESKRLTGVHVSVE